MKLSVFCSVEPASLPRFLEHWISALPSISAIEVHGPGQLAWGGVADVESAEVRAFVLDPRGVRALLAASPIVFGRDRSHRAPIVVLVPAPGTDRAATGAPALPAEMRADVLDLSRAAEATWFDDAAFAIADVPFSDAGFAAIATALMRRVHRDTTPAPKVIAVDADGTLWQGLCAERGPEGVRFGAEDRWLHDFLLAQQQQGMLLALVSKNVPGDVEAVFRERTDCPLRWSDFVATRIGWEAKSLAIAELASELNVGLDAVVFLDDSPAECAEVRTMLPAAHVVPRPTRDVAATMTSTWLFDAPPAQGPGALGEARTRLYQEDARRRAALAAAPSYEAHVASLEVRATVRAATAADHARVFELAQRTNQFNTRSGRPTADAVGAAIDAGGVLVLDVADRFGDYGLSGAVFWSQGDRVWRAERVLLSCRVLGRGVEAALFDLLADRARSAGHDTLAFMGDTTERNVPARAFFAAAAAALDGTAAPTNDGVWGWAFPVATLAPCPRHVVAPATRRDDTSRLAASPDWAQVAAHTSHPAQLVAALGLTPSSSRGTHAADEAGALAIMADVIGAPIAYEDNLYALGVDSLRIVRLVARLQRDLAVDLPLADVLHRADVADVVRMVTAAHARRAASDDGFFDQIATLYDESARP